MICSHDVITDTVLNYFFSFLLLLLVHLVFIKYKYFSFIAFSAIYNIVLFFIHKFFYTLINPSDKVIIIRK